MAQRKLLGYSGATGLGPGFKPKLMRAYAEGRKAGIAGAAANTNPWDTLGIPQETAWDYGRDNAADSAYQFEVWA